VPRVPNISEDHGLFPSNPYSASKAAADTICQAYGKTYKVPVTILRPSTLYGPYQSQTQFIPTVILQTLTSPIIKLGSLNATRDFCYVKDVAAAFLLAGATEKSRGEVFNISSGISVRLSEVVDKILEITKRHVLIETKLLPRPEDSTCMFVINSSKARNILGWSPKCDLDFGLRDTIDFFCSQGVLGKQRG